MSSVGRGGGGASEKGARSDHTHEHRLRTVRRTSVNVRNRTNGPSEGVVHPFQATTAGRQGPYRKSLLTPKEWGDGERKERRSRPWRLCGRRGMGWRLQDPKEWRSPRQHRPEPDDLVAGRRGGDQTRSG